MLRRVIAIAWAAAIGAAGCAKEPVPAYDLVVANARVIDPESGLDAVRHVGVRTGRSRRSRRPRSPALA